MLESLFLTELEISLAVSAVVLILAAVSPASRKRYTAKWRYWVWLILALRLIIPLNFTLPEAPVKIEPPAQQVILTRRPAAQNISDTAPQTPVSAESEPEQPLQSAVQTAPQKNEAPASGNSAAEPQGFTFSLVFCLAVIWLIGAFLTLLWHGLCCLHFKRTVMLWNRAPESPELAELFNRLCAELGTGSGVALYFNKRIVSPMMTGFFKPCIILPDAAFSPWDYEVILRHELTHYRRHDLWYKLIIVLAASLHWFNPFMRTFFREADADLEISCDEAVVTGKSGLFRQEYCEAILRALRRGTSRQLLLSTGFSGSKKTLKNRFEAVLDLKAKKGFALFAGAVLLTAIFGMCVACAPAETPAAEAPSEPSSDTSDVSEPVEETNPLPLVTGPDEDGNFPEIEGYLFDRWVTKGEADSEKPDETKITPFIENKYCKKYLAEAFTDIDDWEVLFEKDIYTLREGMYDPYTYTLRDQYAPNRITVLKTAQGDGFDRLIVVSIDEYAAMVSGNGITPVEEVLCYAIKTTEANISGGDFSGAEVIGLENWYPTIWFPAENRELLLDFNQEIAVNVENISGNPSVVEFAFKFKDGFYLTDNKTLLQTNPQNENDLLVFLKSDSDPERYASVLCYYDAETKSLAEFENGEPEKEQNDYYTQIFFVDNSVLCLMNSTHITMYDISSENPRVPFANLGGSETELLGGASEFRPIIATDRKYPTRHAAIYFGEDSKLYALTFDTDGTVLSNFDLGLSGTSIDSIGSYSYAEGILYFTYYPDGGGYNGVHYGVDARAEKEHILQNMD